MVRACDKTIKVDKLADERHGAAEIPRWFQSF
jgi:hypothetical protein